MTALATRTRKAASTVAGDGLLHPLALGAIAVLLVNDHVLKAAWPGLVTGKLSDFAGLIFFPLFLQASAEIASAALGRWQGPDRRILRVSVVATASVFIAIKTLPAANALVAMLLGEAQWWMARLTVGGAPAAAPVSIVLDPSDLVALPMLIVAYEIGIRRCRGHSTC
jgi:hypothetical protein